VTWILPALALLAFILSGLLVRVLLTEPLRSLVVDTPNERSLHAVPVPRIGGLGLLGAAFALWAFVAPGHTVPILLTALLLAGVSLVDDVVALSPGKRLIVHFGAAIVVLAVFPATPLILAPVVLLTIVWMSNLYNFMDGSDGLAGGMTLIGFSAYAVAAEVAGAEELARVSAIVAGAAGGFLIWNFPKARIFMGDSGSIPLGFLASALGYLGWRDGAWPFYFPALAFLPFIADATVTLGRRALRGEKLSDAHRSHYYQRLNRMGLGHRSTALWGYALMAATAVSALASLTMTHAAAALLIVFWFAAIGTLMIAIDRAWARYERAQDTPAARDLPTT
jgi:UDP-N-acetylmuramyl pentapeptide phosphotransferase/UDP-N-acetylglucosamine-1-phosphate transferase